MDILVNFTAYWRRNECAILPLAWVTFPLNRSMWKRQKASWDEGESIESYSAVSFILLLHDLACVCLRVSEIWMLLILSDACTPYQPGADISFVSAAPPTHQSHSKGDLWVRYESTTLWQPPPPLLSSTQLRIFYFGNEKFFKTSTVKPFRNWFDELIPLEIPDRVFDVGLKELVSGSHSA